MYEDRVILCASNAYEKKFYINPDFDALPKTIKDELKVMCVLFTEEVGGVLEMAFEEDGTLTFNVDHDEGDLLFDEISCGLMIKKIQNDKRDLLEGVEMFYKVFFLNQEM